MQAMVADIGLCDFRASMKSAVPILVHRVPKSSILRRRSYICVGLGAIAALTVATGSLRADPSNPPQHQRVAFSRDSDVWISNLDGTGSRKLSAGENPSISSDGTRLAFTWEPPGKSNTLQRYIAVIEVSTGSKTVFKAVPSDNSFGPVWSADGSQILFEIFVDSHWRVGLINADGSGFRFLNLPSTDAGWFSLCWARDGKSIFCQDLQKICRFNLEGEAIASWEVGKVFPNAEADSSEQFSISPDGKQLLVDLGMENGESMKDFNGPPPSIWLFEIDSGKATRLTPKHSFATAPCWLNDSEYLFIDADKKGTSIFRTSVADGPHKLVVRNAAEPSVSMQDLPAH